MIRPFLLLVGLALGIAGASLAQQVPGPVAPCAMVGAYNAVNQTIATGNFGYVQVDTNGLLRIAP